MRLAAFVSALMLFCSLALAEETKGEAKPVDGDTAALSNRQVGIGLLGGVAFPLPNLKTYEITESWGLFFDFPIISTFHVAPQTIIYRLKLDKDKIRELKNGSGRLRNQGKPFANVVKDSAAADLSVNFKFVLPISDWKIFIGFLMGLSMGTFLENDAYGIHLGGNAGFSYRFAPNLDVLLHVQYRIIFDLDSDADHVQHIQPMAGFMYSF